MTRLAIPNARTRVAADTLADTLTAEREHGAANTAAKRAANTTASRAATRRAPEGFTLWLTGLSGAGKSTLAARLSRELAERGRGVEVLDGDVVRTHLSKGLGFSREDRDANILRIAFVAALLTRHGVGVITAAISPYAAARAQARAMIGNFVEVYVRCDLDELVRRDVKGLYKKALAGEIAHFTGVSDPYEEPRQPDVIVDSGCESVAESLAKILGVLEARGYVAPAIEPVVEPVVEPVR